MASTSGSNNQLTITGFGFGSNSSMFYALCFFFVKFTLKKIICLKAVASVLILNGVSMCSITSISDTQIVCLLDECSAGSYPVVVRLYNQGNSNNDKKFTFNLTITSLSSNIGNT